MDTLTFTISYSGRIEGLGKKQQYQKKALMEKIEGLIESYIGIAGNTYRRLHKKEARYGTTKKNSPTENSSYGRYLNKKLSYRKILHIESKVFLVASYANRKWYN